MSEPCATGSTWRLHYALDLSTLQCEQAHVAAVSVGEGLSHLEVNAGDVLMDDRGLAHRQGVRHVLDHGGDVILRMSSSALPLEKRAEEAQALDLLPKLRGLRVGQVQGWAAQWRDAQGIIPVQVCALRKSARQTRLTLETLHRTARRKGRKLRPPADAGRQSDALLAR